MSGQDVRCELQLLRPTRQGACEEGNGEDENLTEWLFVELPRLGFQLPVQSKSKKVEDEVKEGQQMFPDGSEAFDPTHPRSNVPGLPTCVSTGLYVQPGPGAVNWLRPPNQPSVGI